jgi:hypothetical protein
MTTTRERHITIRWTGDETTEKALLDVLHIWHLKIAPGNCDRWMSIPARFLDAAKAALEAAGAINIKS